MHVARRASTSRMHVPSSTKSGPPTFSKPGTRTQVCPMACSKKQRNTRCPPCTGCPETTSSHRLHVRGTAPPFCSPALADRPGGRSNCYDRGGCGICFKCPCCRSSWRGRRTIPSRRRPGHCLEAREIPRQVRDCHDRSSSARERNGSVCPGNDPVAPSLSRRNRTDHRQSYGYSAKVPK